MLRDLTDVGKLRKRLNITQTELARMAGVSQSLIAKLERGMIDISYSKAKAIFEALENVEIKEHLVAKDLMSINVICVEKDDKVSKATSIMRKNNYSQLPVLSRGICVGSISEQTTLKAIEGGYDPKVLWNMEVEEIMEEAFPMISESSTLHEITALLRENQAVLITKKGKIIGIITKADLLKAAVLSKAK